MDYLGMYQYGLDAERGLDGWSRDRLVDRGLELRPGGPGVPPPPSSRPGRRR
ncbi:MAG: hypothetical protein R3C45_08740 [Phycisphaerales bacterium]